MANIVLLNPRFEPSFWGLEYALPVFGKKANFPVACLPLLAALTPPGHHVSLVDENVEPLDFDRIARADIVGLTGMIVQRQRMREILVELKRRGAFVVVGGPWVTVQEDYFGDLADVLFIGEAEQTWPRFLSDWKQGRHQRRYEQAEKTDMTQVPTPRFDLLKMNRYMFGTLQLSRGCPFQCEFCDIIVTFGRRPRLKTSAQVIAELEALRAQGVRIAFIVDDNLIGNKKAIKVLLRDVIEYQKAHAYPFTFTTEASLDLAEDPELIALMVDANLINVFIGIESPNEESLRETKKYQNVRSKCGTMIERLRTIQRAGLEVSCGMILGFDNDDSSIFRAQTEFMRLSGIPQASVGMLTAIPKTPLHARLAREGRLDTTDNPEYGTNVQPLRMTRAELREGFLRVMQELYEPKAYFDRLDDLYIRQRIPFSPTRAQHVRWNWRRRLHSGIVQNLIPATVVFARLLRQVKDRKLRLEYRRRLLGLIRARQDAGLIMYYVIKCAMHYHHYTLAQQMAESGTVVNLF